MTKRIACLSVLTWVLVVLLSTAEAQQPPVLRVDSLDTGGVNLNWTAVIGASNYVLQRRELGGSYYQRAQVAATTFRDTGTFTTPEGLKFFGTLETYTYRVRAVVGDTTLTSNEVTTGPPPMGFNVVSATPSTVGDDRDYGARVSLALDLNNDPIIAFVHQDPNNDRNRSDSILYFVGWDRTNYRWKAPVQVDVVGEINTTSRDLRQVSLAGERNSSRIAIAYVKNTYGEFLYGLDLWIALSDDNGATWTKKAVYLRRSGTNNEVREPSLALATGGQVHLTFSVESASGIQPWNGLRFVTGSITADPSTWASQQLPRPSTWLYTHYSSVELPIVRIGTPGVAYWLNSLLTPRYRLMYWKPGDASAVEVTGSAFESSKVTLAFGVLNNSAAPCILMLAERDDKFSTAPYNHLWLTCSEDDGKNWMQPVLIPPDGSSDATGPIDLAFCSLTRPGVFGVAESIAGVTETNRAVGTADAKCGNPKLSLSTDVTFTSWKTCSTQGLMVPGSELIPVLEALYPSLACAPWDASARFYLAFLNAGLNAADLPKGVILWRQPGFGFHTYDLPGPAAVPQVPSAGIVNGASFASGAPVAPGSIISIFGTNLAEGIAAADAVPLATTLGRFPVFGGFDKGSTSVSINRRLAPLYYTSAGQVNAQLPFETTTGTASLFVTVNGAMSRPVNFPVANTGPGIFLYGGNRAVVVNPDGNINSASKPARVGDAIVVYMTGQGAVSDPPATGAVALANPLSRVQAPVSARIGGSSAEVLFAGLSPGFVGLMQLNLRVPNVSSGDHPLVVTIGGVDSNSALVTVAQ